MRSKRVVFVDEKLEKAFNSLSEHDSTKKALKKAVKEIQKDCYCGRNVKKQLIPKQWVTKYGINNLWIYNLPSAWRLLYALTNNAKEIAPLRDGAQPQPTPFRFRSCRLCLLQSGTWP